ncbi:RNA-directed DNA polymerase, eukaryota, partial [Tanacetum coccineum]
HKEIANRDLRLDRSDHDLGSPYFATVNDVQRILYLEGVMIFRWTVFKEGEGGAAERIMSLSESSPQPLRNEEERDEADEDTFDDEFGKDNSKANMNFNSEEKQKLQGNNVEDDISNGSLNYPPEFTPIEEGDKKFDKVDKLNGKEQGYTENANDQVNNVEEKSNKGVSSSKEEDKESRCHHIDRLQGPQTEDFASKFKNQAFRIYFVAIQGVWIPNAKKCLIISVYAPQEVSEKRMLWSYLNHVIDNWSSETIIMGDFNEVRSKEERYGSIFNDHNASLFNSFISSGGLVEVPLGGCAFKWCHKSGNKMSKLDRFLISEGLMGMCPNIFAITLDRYLTDHRPILLREVCHDYGPILSHPQTGPGRNTCPRA